MISSEEDALDRFGFPPDPSKGDEIRLALAEGVRRERDQQDSASLRVLCAQLFFLGHPPDTLLVWSAKRASIDAAASVDIQLLCSTGLEATRAYLRGLAGDDARAALARLDECVAAGDFDGFDVQRFRTDPCGCYSDE